LRKVGTLDLGSQYAAEIEALTTIVNFPAGAADPDGCRIQMYTKKAKKFVRSMLTNVHTS